MACVATARVKNATRPKRTILKADVQKISGRGTTSPHAHPPWPEPLALDPIAALKPGEVFYFT